MRRRLLLILPFLMVACNFGAVAAPAVVLPTPSLPLAFTASPVISTSTLPPSPTIRYIASDTPTETPTDTLTATETPISLPSNTPTRTLNLYPHVFPVQPPNLAGFSKGGHPYPATDIFAPLGTRFVAVTNGVVDEVSTVDQWNPGIIDNTTAGGLSVRIIGDDGFRYYGAHLSTIARGILPGVWVPAGQLLGLVGNTGDARNSLPHVHFEISDPAPPFTKVDPFPFLMDWLGGLNITPTLPTL